MKMLQKNSIIAEAKYVDKALKNHKTFMLMA